MFNRDTLDNTITRVKIFEQNSSKDLEEEINNFIEEKNATIVGEPAYTIKSVDEHHTYHCVLIRYSRNKEEVEKENKVAERMKKQNSQLIGEPADLSSMGSVFKKREDSIKKAIEELKKDIEEIDETGNGMGLKQRQLLSQYEESLEEIRMSDMMDEIIDKNMTGETKEIFD